MLTVLTSYPSHSQPLFFVFVFCKIMFLFQHFSKSNSANSKILHRPHVFCVILSTLISVYLRQCLPENLDEIKIKYEMCMKCVKQSCSRKFHIKKIKIKLKYKHIKQILKTLKYKYNNDKWNFKLHFVIHIWCKRTRKIHFPFSNSLSFLWCILTASLICADLWIHPVLNR